MRNAVVVGGSSGIGLAMVKGLVNKGYSNIYVFDKQKPQISMEQITYTHFDAVIDSYDVFDKYIDQVDTLLITAGFGRVAPFETYQDPEIKNNLLVNAVAPIRVVSKFYQKLLSTDDFYCTIMGSIAGFISSPLFAIYGAGKSAACQFIENVNIEIEQVGSPNRILNVSPGAINGTSFKGGTTDLTAIEALAEDILSNMYERNTLFIPDIDVYGSVLERYKKDAHKFGMESYDYKIKSGRMNTSPQLKIGYLSGTFDLFHVGHLNLLKRARAHCDYLVVGVHKDASHKGKETFISFEERKAIVEACKYVDEVIESYPEDKDVWEQIPYNFLFVGSDYKGTERFESYEEYFSDKPVEIVYFDYTKGTSSTHLREAIGTVTNK